MITLETVTPVAKQCSCKPNATIVRRGNFLLCSHNQLNGETGRKLQDQGSSQAGRQVNGYCGVEGGGKCQGGSA